VIRLAVRVAREDAEIALAELLELVPAGVEEIDRGDSIEYAVYGAAGELPAMPALRAAAGAALVEITTTEVADDWDTRWRSFHKPLTIDARLHVRPPWTDAPDPAEGLIDIVIDPAQAFGTGAHDTTRLCLEALLSLESGGPFVDLGCGSGVLAIAAAMFGASDIDAVDIDPAAVEATAANAQANDVVVRCALPDEATGPYALIVANILAAPLKLLAPLLSRRLEPGGQLVLSGILARQADELRDAYRPWLDLDVADQDDGWALMTGVLRAGRVA
jgi:ribosomal protein L11 methyltransferase